MAEPKAYEWVELTVAGKVHSMAVWTAGQQVGSKAAWKAGTTAAKKEKKMGESKDQHSAGYWARKLVVTMAAQWAVL